MTAGVAAAADALDEGALNGHFAVPSRRGKPIATSGPGPVRYRRRASPLHAARAASGGVGAPRWRRRRWRSSTRSSVVALTLVVLAGAAAAGVAREVGRIALWMVPWALTIAVINALVVREG